jgi:hypothetical protein
MRVSLFFPVRENYKLLNVENNRSILLRKPRYIGYKINLICQSMLNGQLTVLSIYVEVICIDLYVRFTSQYNEQDLIKYRIALESNLIWVHTIIKYKTSLNLDGQNLLHRK